MPRTVPALIALAAILLRLPDLDRSLWYDEVLYSTLFPVPSFRALLDWIAHDAPAPLFRFLMFSYNRAFGENEIVVRLPSLAFGVGAILLTYRLALGIAGAAAAALAALFLAFSPVHVWYSQDATPHSMTLCLLLSAVALARRLRDGGGRRGFLVLYGVLLSALPFAHYFAAGYLIPLSIVAWRAERKTRDRMLLAHGVALALVGLWLLGKKALGLFSVPDGFLRPYTLFEWWMEFFNWLLLGNSIWTVNPYHARPGWLLEHPGLLAVQAAFLALLLRGLLLRGNRLEKRESFELALFLAILPGSMFILTQAGLERMYIERYLLGLLPFYAIALARGATSLGARTFRLGGACAMLALSVASSGFFLHKRDVWTVYKKNPDWRAFAADLKRGAPGVETTLFGVVPLADLQFYLDREGLAERCPIVGATRETLDRALAERGPEKRVWLVKNLSWPGPFSLVPEFLTKERGLEVGIAIEYRGIEVYGIRAPNP